MQQAQSKKAGQGNNALAGRPQGAFSQWWLPLALAALSGGLLLLSFPPHGPGFLAFLALVPLIHAAEGSNNLRRAFLIGTVFGLVFFVPGAHWVSFVSSLAWILLAGYCALYFGVFGWICRFFYPRSGALYPILLVAGWTLLEQIRFFLLTGFAWFPIAHSQHAFHPFIQSADLAGTHGLGAVVVGVNAALARGLADWRRSEAFQARMLLKPALAALALLAGPTLYGVWRLQTLEVVPSVRVAVVQASVPQQLKEVFTGSYSPEKILEDYLSLSKTLAGQNLDLVVWPETVVLPPHQINISPNLLTGYLARKSQWAQNELASLALALDSHLLIGAIVKLPPQHGYVGDPAQALRIPEADWNQRFNSAILFDPQGRYLDRYDKIHIVPFGEYIPLRSVFPFLAELVPFQVMLSPGQRHTVFRLKAGERETTFGAMICYDDMFSGLARRLRRSGADFLVTISNDAWYQTSSELDQHFVAARFRAIENRLGLVRSGNNGITGLIGPDGAVDQLLGSQVDGEVVYKDSHGVLIGQLRTSSQGSLYTALGDQPVFYLAAILLLVGFVRLARVRRQHLEG